MGNPPTPQFHPAQVKHGLIVWLDDCPPLDDDKDKRRPVIVVEPSPDPESPDEPPAVIVVACSASYGPNEPDGVALPNRSTEPQTTTGLPKPCWAIPRWFFPISRERLLQCQYSGSLGGRKLRAVLVAYLARRDAAI